MQKADLKTGEMLDKPIVTVFSTKEEMDTPTLEQKVNENGVYTLSWSEIEDADYYEVYEYRENADYSTIEVTTENTSCTYDEFKTLKDWEKHFKETYRDTEIDVDDPTQWRMNIGLEEDKIYFVVARTYDGKKSGMSNFCTVGDISKQIPYTVSEEFQESKRKYEGDSALALPVYIDIEMLDGSIGTFLIEYHGAEVMLFTDGTIHINSTIKNLPIEMSEEIIFSGMEYEEFLKDMENVTKRQDELAAKSVTVKKEINVPYLPDKDYEVPVESETTEAPKEMVDSEKKNDRGFNLSEEVEDTVYANSALSEWIALNMLGHQEEIYLGDFAESSDSEKLMDAVMEAYTQNPLIGIMKNADYNYKKRVLEVQYALSAEETSQMQEESLKKAEEIVHSIIKDSMSDYEKEEAINQYICENGTYNDEILKYINPDGTIDTEAVERFANSFTPYGILVENIGVCESYAEAFLLLAKKSGIDAVIVTGTLEGVNHEWNRVNIEGQWYAMDVTNNDCENLPNCYFNLPDQLADTMLLQNKDAFLDSYISQYTAKGMNFEYYTKHSLTAADVSEAVEMLVTELSKKEAAIVRVQEESDEDTIEEIVKDTFKQAEVSSGQYYYKAGVLSLKR